MPYVDRRVRVAHRHRIAVLHGSELNIAADGSLDWDDDFLAGFDVLVAFAIDTDAHAVPHLDYTRYGVAVGQLGGSRRGDQHLAAGPAPPVPGKTTPLTRPGGPRRADRCAHSTSGSPERRRTASRAARCNWTAAAQSVPIASTG